MTVCVYMIQCSATDKIYIGSTRDLKRRTDAHFTMLRHKKHHSLHLQRAFDKHGEAAFSIHIAEHINDVVFLRAREQMWLNRLAGNLYNVSANASMHVKTEDQMQAHRQRMLGNTFRRGSKMPQEAKAAISASLIGNQYRAGIPHEQTIKDKIGAGLKKAYAEGRKKRRAPNPKNLAKRNFSQKAASNTRKERFLELDADGKSRRQIADDLGIALDTVSHYRELKKKGLL